jgi:hypothetical protein
VIAFTALVSLLIGAALGVVLERQGWIKRLR